MYFRADMQGETAITNHEEEDDDEGRFFGGGLNEEQNVCHPLSLEERRLMTAANLGHL